MISTFFQLLIGHAVCDFPLQGDFIGRYKNHNTPSPIRETIWPYLLTAHALIHAGAVWLITGNVLFGCAEFVTHWTFDFLKSDGVTDFHQDQAFHALMKLFYATFLSLPR